MLVSRRAAKPFDSLQDAFRTDFALVTKSTQPVPFAFLAETEAAEQVLRVV